MRIGTIWALFLIFIVLKLTGSIDWNWIWVFSPLWIYFTFWAVIILIIASVKASSSYNYKRW